jgi:hypothetical protein
MRDQPFGLSIAACVPPRRFECDDTSNAGRFGKGIGESIHVILVCLDPIIFPCCVGKENTREPSNTPVVVVLGVADPPRRHQVARVLGCAGAIRSGA